MQIRVQLSRDLVREINGIRDGRTVSQYIREAIEEKLHREVKPSWMK